MTHLILINPDQSFIYLNLAQPSIRILQDIRVGGSLPDYINPGASPRNATVNYSALMWQNWVVVFPGTPEILQEESWPLIGLLTRRQLDVLYCLSQGLTGKQIANRLNIHPRSVSLHTAALKRSLNANTAAECVQKAARLGILKPGG